jgi:hypothetical protein
LELASKQRDFISPFPFFAIIPSKTDLLEEIQSSELALVAASGAPPAALVLQEHLTERKKERSKKEEKGHGQSKCLLIVGPEGQGGEWL